MSKIKIEEVALEAGANDKDALEKAKELGFKVRAKNSTINEQEAEMLMNYLISGKMPEKKSVEKKPAAKKTVEKKPAEKKTSVKEEPKSEASTAKEERAELESETEVVAGEEKVEVETKEAEKAEEIQPKPAPKKRKGITTTSKEPPKVEVSVEPQAKKQPLKRRGITIVKKKNPKPIKKEEPAKALFSQGMGAPTPAKKKRKKTPVSAKESGQRLELGERNLGGTNELYEEEEVVLLDFSDKNIYEEAQRQEVRRKEEARKRALQGGNQHNNMNRTQSRSSGRRKKKKRDYKKEIEPKEVGVVKIPEDVRVYEFAEKVGKSVGEIVKVLFTLGTMVTKNDFLDKDAIEILAEEFEVQVETINPLDALDYVAQYDDVEDEVEEERAPVVTIMGHVDHGKTSLLDKIRETKVAAKEAGGITQHVGAYQVEKSGKKITFIDTPGHSAFTEMRARGAQATDIAIVVVAADDGVMPQTKESISHAKAADVPIIIAVNKIDKPEANIDNVKSQLSELGIMPVEWGGEYEFAPVSAHSGEGIDELLETILLQAEIMELVADKDRKAKAIVVESSLEKGLGCVANIIVKNGSLSVGDNIIAGTTYGRVKTMILDDGSRAKKIGPSTPAAIVGLNEVPQAGDVIVGVESEKEAREIAEKRRELARVKELSKSTKVSLDELSDLIAEGKIKKLPVLVKADVQGSLEAIKKSLEELKNDEVEIQIIHSGVGGITESDVLLADASEHCYIIGFNVRPTGAVKNKAKELGVEIKTYNIIYGLLDDAKALLGGLMSPVISEEVVGQAEVRQTFAVAKVGTIAGCMVTDGKIERHLGARLIRDGVVVYTTHLSSLKRFNDDVKEVGKGYECGIMLENYNDLKEGDVIEVFKEKEEQATL
ncbi:MAG TPA: translation initiation factor IF-2 [Nitratifractor sp.]|nr:translation initiation factor IF-2 [Nitratifractor sp.]HHD74427.1 translation initiation factor IF-2 [Nitratifractor sp.]